MKKWIFFILLKSVEIPILVFVPYYIGSLIFLKEQIQPPLILIWFIGLACFFVGLVSVFFIGIGFYKLIELNLKWSKRLGEE